MYSIFFLQNRIGSEGGGRGLVPIQKSGPSTPKCSVKWLHCAMFVLVTHFCLAFSDADIEFDFVLLTSA